MEIKDYIRARRIELMLSQLEVAKYVGVSEATVSRWESGDIANMGAGRIKLLAEVLQTNPLSILGEISPESKILSFSLKEQEHITKYRGCDASGKQVVDDVLDHEYTRSMEAMEEIPTTTVPLCYESAAAGFGNYLSDHPEFEDKEFPAKVVPYGTDFAVTISGNSMEPEIPDGSIVFVHATPAIENGQIGLFFYEDVSFCKRLEVNHDLKRVRLLSTNPDYAPIVIGEEEYLHTFGRVIGYITREDINDFEDKMA